MTYKFGNRLQHANDRFGEVNRGCFIYIRPEEPNNIEFPVVASPILISADEFSGGDVATVRVERHDFAIDVSEIQRIYPPRANDRLRNQETREEFMLVSMGGSDPPYVHTTSNRSRVIVHTNRYKKAYP